MAKFTGTPRYNTPAWDGVTVTHEGGQGYLRPARQELFLQAVTEMAEDTFYESAEDRQFRLAQTVKAVAVEPGGWEWLCQFVTWLRKDAGMRSASIMVAAEAVAAGRPEKDAGGLTARQLVSAACLRADEPAEFLGYWLTFHGRQLPAPVRRGIADAAVRLYTERSALRYDGQSRSVRMADVIDLVHPRPSTPEQSALFLYLLDRRHNRTDLQVDQLQAVAARQRLESLTPSGRHSFMRTVQAGQVDAVQLFQSAMAGQWEWAKSWLGAQ